MARKSTNSNTRANIEHKEKYDCPKTLSDHPFFGLKLDQEQEVFRDAIWDDTYDIVFCDSKSGSGKTTIAVSTALLLCEYGKYNGVVYQVAGGVHEYKQGLLPGNLEEKSAPLFIPLNQAVARIGYDPQRTIVTDYNVMSQKEGSALIVASTDSYIRGISIGEIDSPMVVILDEAQNYTLAGLRTVLTRINDGSKAIVIGQTKQCDLKYPQDSGFDRMMRHFSEKEWCKICTLSKNYRGRISSWADEL